MNDDEACGGIIIAMDRMLKMKKNSVFASEMGQSV